METKYIQNDLELLARALRFSVEIAPPFDGRGAPPGPAYIHTDTNTGLTMCAFYTRDVGHHTSGWFKNPDYERCYHLSMSFRPADHDGVKAAIKELSEFVFRDDVRCAWVESAKTPEGRELGVVHYRVFCNAHWQPLIPRGEVYSAEFTEKGWRSWSEVHGPEPTFHTNLENPDR